MHEQTRQEATVTLAPLAMFSPRERAVVERTLAGLTLKEMGGELGCDLRTCHAYRKRAMLKCGARNLIELVRIVSGWAPAARAGGGEVVARP